MKKLYINKFILIGSSILIFILITQYFSLTPLLLGQEKRIQGVLTEFDDGCGEFQCLDGVKRVKIDGNWVITHLGQQKGASLPSGNIEVVNVKLMVGKKVEAYVRKDTETFSNELNYTIYGDTAFGISRYYIKRID